MIATSRVETPARRRDRAAVRPRPESTATRQASDVVALVPDAPPDVELCLPPVVEVLEAALAPVAPTAALPAQVRPAAPPVRAAAAADEDDEAPVEVEIGSVEDPVRLYLREIGRVPLLTQAEEVTLATAIELGVAAVDRMRSLGIDPDHGPAVGGPPALREGGDAPSADEIARLLAEYQAGEVARRKLTEANLRLVVSIAKKHGNEGLDDESITVDLYGTAGQSFGAWLARMRRSHQPKRVRCRWGQL